MRRGVMYTATGAPYIEQAAVSIGSMRRWNDNLYVAVFTDNPSAFAGIADHVGVVEPGQLPRDLPREQRMLTRLRCLQRSPFEQTLALDTDTVVLGPIEEMFDVLDRVSVAICQGHQRSFRHEAALRAGKASAQIPYAFAPLQGGVILFDDQHGRQFVDDVVAKYEHKQFIDDQVSMREVLWEAEYRFATLGPEYNLYRLAQIDDWAGRGFRDAWPKIFHTVTLKDRLPPADIDELLLPIAVRADRRRRAGFGPDGPTKSPGVPRAPVERLRAVRSRAGAWRATRRLRRRLRNAHGDR